MKLSLQEIKDWQQFEDLIANYFRRIHTKDKEHLTEVFVEPSGIGSDGGRDILVTFRVDSALIVRQYKWVIQCKFYSTAVSKSALATVNIPSLIHEHGANGYLLVVKSGVISKVSEMFENFRKNCKLGYSYLIWNESELLSKLRNTDLIEEYFPKYYEYKNK